LKIREYGIVEDDLPLQGPWTRRKDSSRSAQPRPADNTEGRETDGKKESVEESPLQGPWSGRGEDPVSREGEREYPRTERKRRPAPQEPDGRPRTASVKESARPAGDVAVLAPCVSDVPDVSDAPARDSCPTGRRRRLMPDLFTQKGIYQGFIMAEILGSRGGRSRRRPY